MRELIFDTIGDESAAFPVTVNNLSDIIAQLFVLGNMKWYKVIIHEDFIILIKGKKKLSNTLHIAPDNEFIF